MSERARVRMCRANNLCLMGRHGEAEESYSVAQHLYDRLRDINPVHSDRALIRMNRANNLLLVGHHAFAETLFEQAQGLLDRLLCNGAVLGNRARVRMSRASNLSRMGCYREAEELYHEAQQAFDGLDDSNAARSSQARVRMNRAGNMGGLGLHKQAERLFREAQERFDRLLDCSPTDRARVRSNRANGLQALGRRREADLLYGEALQFLDQSREDDAVLSERALVRMNKANNLKRLDRASEAEALYVEAQSFFDRLPDSDAARLSRAMVRVNRLDNVVEQDPVKNAEAMAPLDEALQLLLSLQVHSGVGVPELCCLMAQRVAGMSRAGTIGVDNAASAVRNVAAQALTWLDTMVDPSLSARAVPPGSSEVAASIQLALSWLLESGRAEQALELLADYYGRFAAAQRLLAEGTAGSDDPDSVAPPAGASEAQVIAHLKIQLRSLAGEVQALEARDSSAHDSEFEHCRHALARQRQQVLDELLERLRTFRKLHEPVASLQLKRLCGILGAERALVVVLQGRVPKPGSDQELMPQAMALVICPGQPDAKVVRLPETVLQFADVRHPARSPLRGSSGPGDASGTPDGCALRSAVQAGWNLIVPFLGAAREVHIAVHQALGELPWQAAAEEGAETQSVSVHHSIALALHALEREAQAPVTGPAEGRPLGLLAHSLPQPLDQLEAIPGVYADLAVTTALVPHHVLLEGREAVLKAAVPLLQMSCHGEAERAFTGQGTATTSAYELLEALRRRDARLDACILMACSSGQAGYNPWGEAAGWAPVLHERAQLVVGALYPVDDLCCSLYVLLLHRAWRAGNDLKAAMAQVRRRLRSGVWADSEAELQQVLQLWLDALAAEHRDTARSVFDCRSDAYAHLPELRLVTEALTVFG